jgi:UDP-N-acetylmuramoylalanine--D-glutamate ligase
MRWPRSASLPRRTRRLRGAERRQCPRAAEAAARSTPGLLVFGEHPVSRARGWRMATWSIARQGKPIEKMMPLSGIPLKGAHNVENVLAAVCAARLAGVRRPKRFARAIEKLPGRRASPGVRGHHQRRRVLQRLQGHQRGRDRQGRRRVSGGIHLILGGKDKNSDYTQLRRTAARAGARRLHHRLGGGQDRVATARRGFHPLLRDAGQGGQRGGLAARPGEVVLLAPACSSFDQFENYEQRGRVFKELVNEWRGWKVWQNA